MIDVCIFVCVHYLVGLINIPSINPHFFVIVKSSKLNFSVELTPLLMTWIFSRLTFSLGRFHDFEVLSDRRVLDLILHNQIVVFFFLDSMHNYFSGVVIKHKIRHELKANTKTIYEKVN